MSKPEITVDLNDPESCERFNQMFETPEQTKARHDFMAHIHNPANWNWGYIDQDGNYHELTKEEK